MVFVRGQPFVAGQAALGKFLFRLPKFNAGIRLLLNRFVGVRFDFEERLTVGHDIATREGN
jgi:hypothetical protein